MVGVESLVSAALDVILTVPGAVVSITIASLVPIFEVRDILDVDAMLFPAASVSVADEPRATVLIARSADVSLAPTVYSFVTVLTPFNSAAVMFITSPVFSVTFKPADPARVTSSLNVRVILISSPTVYDPADLSVLTATLGAVVSIVNVCVAATLVLFAASLAVTDIEFVPFALTLRVPLSSSAEPELILQVPSVAVAEYVAPAKTTVTVEPTSAVPVMVGVAVKPVEALVIVGTPGSAVSITNSCAVDEVTLPAVSVDVATML